MAIVIPDFCNLPISMEEIFRSILRYDDVAEKYLIDVNATVSSSSSVPSTGAVTTHNIGITNVEIANADYAGGAIITSDQANTVFVGLGFVPTATDYTFVLRGDDGTGLPANTIVLDAGDFSGSINVISDVAHASGSVKITKLTA